MGKLGKLLGRDGKGLGDLLGELRQVTIDYTKQETLEPLKGLVRYLVLGTAAAFCFSIGFVLWMIAGLRALQTETGSTFTGNWSWAPYGLTMLGALLVVGLALSAIGREKRAAERRKQARGADS